MDYKWGNYPTNFTPNMYWGARAIIELDTEGHRSLGLLPDRQCFERLDGSQINQEEFINWINDVALPHIRKEIKSRSFTRMEDTIILDSSSGEFLCEATPKNSGGGYLYIGVWECPCELQEGVTDNFNVEV